VNTTFFRVYTQPLGNARRFYYAGRNEKGTIWSPNRESAVALNKEQAEALAADYQGVAEECSS
jgi:hypothetical protein